MVEVATWRPAGLEIVVVAGGVIVLGCIKVTVINKKHEMSMSASRIPFVVQMGCAMVVVTVQSQLVTREVTTCDMVRYFC